MKIKEINIKEILDSRREKTIALFLKTGNGIFTTSSPSGKSIGKYETPAFIDSIRESITNLDRKIEEIKKINFSEFKDLEKLEQFVKKNEVGANILFALEASILKALAFESGKELWEYLKLGTKRFPMPVGNIVEGGMHSRGICGKKPDFQEFLVIPRTKKFFDANYIMKHAQKIVGERLKLRRARGRLSDEKGWSTNLGNELVLEILDKTREEIVSQIDCKLEIGVDVASSSFFDGLYSYKNPPRKIDEKVQIDYILNLAEKYKLGYVEDPLNEDDFSSFEILRDKIRTIRYCLIVGDDLTASQLDRTRKALSHGSVNAMIVKPNQNGSLIEIKKIIDFCRKNEIATIMSHRSGETLDYTIADLAFGWQCDFIKTGVIGKEREVKLNRLVQIEGKI